MHCARALRSVLVVHCMYMAGMVACTEPFAVFALRCGRSACDDPVPDALIVPLMQSTSLDGAALPPPEVCAAAPPASTMPAQNAASRVRVRVMVLSLRLRT